MAILLIKIIAALEKWKQIVMVNIHTLQICETFSNQLIFHQAYDKHVSFLFLFEFAFLDRDPT